MNVVQPAKAEIVQKFKQPKLHINESTREDIHDIIGEVLQLDFYSVQLEGHEQCLFKKKFTFSDAHVKFTKNPTLECVDCLLNMISMTTRDLAVLATELKTVFGGLIGFFESYTFSNSPMERPDSIFLQSFLKFFLELPIISSREVYAKDKKYDRKKYNILGKFDIVCGKGANGKKPSIDLLVDENVVQKVSVCEAKNFTVRLSGGLQNCRW